MWNWSFLHCRIWKTGDWGGIMYSGCSGLHQVLCAYIMAPSLVFLMEFLSVWTSASLFFCVCVFCFLFAFSWRILSFCLFVLLNPDVLVFVLSYYIYIISYYIDYYLLKLCFISSERKKGSEFRWEGAGRSEGREP